MKKQEDHRKDSDKTVAAVCGLYCEACAWYSGINEDPERLKRISAEFRFAEVEGTCHGCRSDTRLSYCEKCVMFACAARRGIDFCGQCEDFPCDELRRFQSAMPHRIELWANLERINSVGYKQWLKEIRERYICPRCETVNSTYDLKCRHCGGEPGCDYIVRYKEEIERYLRKRQAMVTATGSSAKKPILR